MVEGGRKAGEVVKGDCPEPGRLVSEGRGCLSTEVSEGQRVGVKQRAKQGHCGVWECGTGWLALTVLGDFKEGEGGKTSVL